MIDLQNYHKNNTNTFGVAVHMEEILLKWERTHVSCSDAHKDYGYNYAPFIGYSRWLQQLSQW